MRNPRRGVTIAIAEPNINTSAGIRAMKACMDLGISPIVVSQHMPEPYDVANKLNEISICRNLYKEPKNIQNTYGWYRGRFERRKFSRFK